MKHVSILVPAGDAVVGSIEGPYKVLEEVNNLLKLSGKLPLFRIDLVGISPEVRLNQGRISLHPSKTIHQKFKTDLVIIPAPHGDLVRLIRINHDLIHWIIEQRRAGAEIASLCMGAFFLAATGLVDGKRCATHWMAANEFRRLFPQVQLETEKVVVDEGGVYSSGGAFSYLNLILYLIEKYAGREIAVTTAKVFEVDIERESQSPFIIFSGTKNHEDFAVRKVQEYIESNYRDKITVDQLASMACLSRRNLERRFKRATFCTTLEYIQRVKVEAAKLSLESTSEEVPDIMNGVGYNDRKAFREVFRRITGLSPLEYRTKYSQVNLRVSEHSRSSGVSPRTNGVA
jgi:transcriptional regulator GlxA family with amidase domain